ncbi:phosphoglycerate mutase [Whalleya microplaca]|nr:phosphoglycerate mutase [Whalleya microplaca]
MPATIHLVRHAEGVHNLSRENEAIRDPSLTSLGKQQCAALKRAFPYRDKLTHLFASPLRRALYTCLLSFSSLDRTAAPGSRPPVLALPEFQEVSDSPCDTGSEPGLLATEFADLVDLSRVPAGWTETVPWVSYASKLDELKARARAARRVLWELLRDSGSEEHVVVVTHGAFLHFLTQDYHGIAEAMSTGWKNTEFRSYQFADPTGDDPEARLIETEESWQRRQAANDRPNKEEQAELQRTFFRQLEPHVSPRDY